jgi:hypothetical protein
MLNKNGQKAHELHQLLLILQLCVRHVRLHQAEGEVTYSETKVKFGNESQIRKRNNCSPV